MPSKTTRTANARALTRQQLDFCRSLSSFRKFVEARPDKDRVGLLLDDSRFRDFLVERLEELDGANACFAAVVRALFALTKDLPSVPFGKQVRLLF